MWNYDENAEIIAMNPWGGQQQTQPWSAVGRGNSSNQPSFNNVSNMRFPDIRNTRPWNEHAVAGAPFNGQSAQWNVPVHAQRPNTWNMNQAAWGAGTTAGPSTYADHAKKNMGVGCGRGHNSVSNSRFDTPQAWNVKVEQHAVWDAPSASAVVPEVPTIDGKADWSGVNSMGSVPARYPGGQWPSQPGGTADWSHQRPEGWAGPQPHPTALVAAGIPSATWAQNQPGMAVAIDQYDPNPQTPGPWVQPRSTDMNNDMMWRDPNPKQKKVQRDLGTSVWGDPGIQIIDVHRWKDVDLGDYSHIRCTAPSGSDWNANPVSSGVVSSNTSPPTDTTAWNECRFTDDRFRFPSPIFNWNALKGDDGYDSTYTMRPSDLVKRLVSKGLIDASVLNRPLTPGLVNVLSNILSKYNKMQQLQRDLQNALQMGSQKCDLERTQFEIQNLNAELIQLKASLCEKDSVKDIQPINGVTQFNSSDGQSRLNQWKQANNAEPSMEKVSSDPTVKSLMNVTNNLSLEDTVDWQTGSLDWSAPSGNTVAGVGVGDLGESKGDNSSNADKVAHSNSQSPGENLSPSVDVGPREFVPGKLWVWRDPKKVAEDPNAKPGDSNPASFISPSFQGNTGIKQSTQLNESAVAVVPFASWPNAASGFASDVWSNRPRHPIGQSFSSRMPPTPLPQGNIPRSALFPYQRQVPLQVNWVAFHLHGISDKQVITMCNKISPIHVCFCPNGSQFVYVKFHESVEIAINRIKAEFPYLQMKMVPDAEVERASRARGTGGSPIMTMNIGNAWNGMNQTIMNDPSLPWTFGGVAQCHAEIQQSHIFQNDDLNRPF